MAIPVLIDTDLGIDDAVAVSLALASDALDLRAIVGVGGSVGVDQVMINIGRMLDALNPPTVPMIGRGLDQTTPGLSDRRDLFGEDGLGNWDRPDKEDLDPSDFRDVYRRTIEDAGGALNILSIGPLSNLAAILADTPSQLQSVRRVYVAGGAVWAKGDANEFAEFSFHRDPQAASKILSAGLPLTVIPLDVAGLVCLDQSHAAHMAASGYRTGEVPSQILEYVLEQNSEPGYGKAFVPAAVAVGSMIWPDLFLKTRMRLEIATDGREAGRCKPALGGDKSKQIDLLTAVNAVDFQENMLESLCHEAFIV